MKLYKITTAIEKFNPAYVLANDPKEAEDIVKDWLEKEKYGFSKNRIVTHIEPIAETRLYTEYKSVLIGKDLELKTN